MYPFIKVSKGKQTKIFYALILILCSLVLLWFFLCGVQLDLDSAIIHSNTELVSKDTSAIRVEHINEDGKLYLSDLSQVEDSQITEYIRTEIGSGTYYIPDSMMSAEITKSDAVNMGKRFMILDWVIFIMCICLFIYRKNPYINFLYGSITVFDLFIYKFYLVNIVRSAFPISWFCTGRFLVFLIGTLLVYKKVFKKDVR